MDDVIDLRQLIKSLLRHWRLILSLTLIGVLAAVLTSLAQPTVYEAVALVSVSAPTSLLQLRAPNSSETLNLPVRDYPELALSGDVVSPLYAKVAASLPSSINNLGEFENQLTVEAALDPTLVRLKVRDSDPQRAALIANQWAEAFALRAGQLYGQDAANLLVYQQRLAAAQSKLKQADDDLAAFQSTNRNHILSAQLASQQASLMDYLNRQHQLQVLSQDTHDLLTQLDSLSATDPANLTDDMALVSLSSRIYGLQSSPANSVLTQLSVPIQLQVSPGQPLTGPTVASQRTLAQNLSDLIASRLIDVANQMAALEPEIMALQGQVATGDLTETQLIRIRDLAQSQFGDLNDQVQQAQIAAQVATGSVQLVSQALVPSRPVNTRRALLALAGGALGLLLGLFLALIAEWWSAPPTERAPTSD